MTERLRRREGKGETERQRDTEKQIETDRQSVVPRPQYF